MADNSRPIANLNSVAVLSNNDKVVVVLANGAVMISPVSSHLANASVTIGKLIMSNNASTPANSSIAVTPGEMWTDGLYLYVGTGNNAVKRVALSIF
jgi:hypothetical protein